MTIATKCCSCGDEVVSGSDVWKGAHEGETACSMLCRYRSLVEATEDWTMSTDAERAADMMRVAAARVALLYDPTIFSDYEPLVVTVYAEDTVTKLTAPMVVLDVTKDGPRLEVVGGEWQDDNLTLRWEEIVDVRIQNV